MMLASAPVFAASFLITKGLTRTERTTVIVVWQSITVALCSLPLALLHWQSPPPLQWGCSWCAVCWAALATIA
jgi:drug/metabolite transporter (DMT)-like permease